MGATIRRSSTKYQKEGIDILGWLPVFCSPMKLSKLNKGASATIVLVTSRDLEVALMKYGVMCGDLFTLSDIAPMGGPLALEIDGNKVAIRKSDAEKIEVKVNS